MIPLVNFFSYFHENLRVLRGKCVSGFPDSSACAVIVKVFKVTLKIFYVLKCIVYLFVLILSSKLHIAGINMLFSNGRLMRSRVKICLNS